MELITKLRQLRVTLGFTVHSPFAYRFIRRVLRERLPYYAFREDVKEPVERLLFRTVCFFNPHRVYCVDSRAAEVIKIALPHAEIITERGKADFIYSNGSSEIASEEWHNGQVLFCVNPLREDWAKLEQGGAMTFRNRKLGIAVWRRMLPAQHFKVNMCLR